jgi:hypothetical protein
MIFSKWKINKSKKDIEIKNINSIRSVKGNKITINLTDQ